MENTRILVAVDDRIAQIRVIGRATFLCSQSFRNFCLQSIEADLNKIVIDLSECLSMDSTFMGVLAMVGLRAQKKKISIEIANSDDTKKKLLKVLGVSKLFTFTHTESDTVNWDALCKTQIDNTNSGTKLSQAETMLEAHETLIEVDVSNSPKFKDIVEFLKKDIKKLSSSE